MIYKYVYYLHYVNNQDSLYYYADSKVPVMNSKQYPEVKFSINKTFNSLDEIKSDIIEYDNKVYILEDDYNLLKEEDKKYYQIFKE
jgi:hypothetical protein